MNLVRLSLEELEEFPSVEPVNPWMSAGKYVFPSTGRIKHADCNPRDCRHARHILNNR